MAEKKKSGIHIKKENKGKFTQWCKDHGYEGPNASCEEEGLAAKSAGVRKMANFSRNSKKWNKTGPKG